MTVENTKTSKCNKLSYEIIMVYTDLIYIAIIYNDINIAIGYSFIYLALINSLFFFPFFHFIIQLRNFTIYMSGYNI